MIFDYDRTLQEAIILSSLPRVQLRSDDALRRKFRAAKGNALDIAFQWTQQGVIGTAKQFRQIVGEIVEKEVNRIAEEMNAEAAGEIDYHGKE